MIYVAGFIWAEIKQLYQEGLHQYMVGDRHVGTRLDPTTDCLGGHLESTGLDDKLFVFGHDHRSCHGLH
jgi:hypothetical protein